MLRKAGALVALLLCVMLAPGARATGAGPVVRLTITECAVDRAIVCPYVASKTKGFGDFSDEELTKAVFTKRGEVLTLVRSNTPQLHQYVGLIRLLNVPTNVKRIDPLAIRQVLYETPACEPYPWNPNNLQSCNFNITGAANVPNAEFYRELAVHVARVAPPQVTHYLRPVTVGGYTNKQMTGYFRALLDEAIPPQP